MTSLISGNEGMWGDLMWIPGVTIHGVKWPHYPLAVVNFKCLNERIWLGESTTAIVLLNKWTHQFNQRTLRRYSWYGCIVDLSGPAQSKDVIVGFVPVDFGECRREDVWRGLSEIFWASTVHCPNGVVCFVYFFPCSGKWQHVLVNSWEIPLHRIFQRIWSIQIVAWTIRKPSITPELFISRTRLLNRRDVGITIPLEWNYLMGNIMTRLYQGGDHSHKELADIGRITWDCKMKNYLFDPETISLRRRGDINPSPVNECWMFPFELSDFKSIWNQFSPSGQGQIDYFVYQRLYWTTYFYRIVNRLEESENRFCSIVRAKSTSSRARNSGNGRNCARPERADTRKDLPIARNRNLNQSIIKQKLRLITHEESWFL
jgi:hypothetical protein